MDLSKLSDADLMALQHGDLSKVSDEGLSHLSGQPAAPTPAPDTSGAGQAGLEHFANSATGGYLPHIQAGLSQGVQKLAGMAGMGPEAVNNDLQKQGFKLPESGYVQERDQNINRLKTENKEHPDAAMAGDIAGIGSSLLIPGGVASKGASTLAKLGIGAGTGAAIAGLSNPGDKQGELSPLQASDRAINAAAGGAIGGTLAGASQAAPKLADWLMGKAAGIRKMVPGMGNALVDEGIAGTKGQMLSKVKNQLGVRGEELNNAVNQIKGDIDVSPMAQKLAEKAEGYKVAGKVPSNATDPYSKFSNLAEDVGSTGNMSPQDLLKFKRLQGEAAYNASGNPANSYAGDVAKTAGGESKGLLEKAFSDQNPNLPNAVADSNQILHTLLKAKKGLEMGPTLSQVAEKLILPSIGAGAGIASGNGKQAGLLAALGAGARSPLAMSYAARMAQKLGPKLQNLTPLLSRLVSQNEDGTKK